MSIDTKRLLSRRPARRQVLWAIGIGGLFLALAAFVHFGYLFGWEWTGFPQKNLFDWLQIAVLPVAVAIGTFALNRAAQRRDAHAQREQRERDAAAQQEQRERDMAAQQEQREREQAIEAGRAEESALQAYLDYMSRMLTDPDRPLRRSHLGDDLSLAARAQTLTVLARLESGERKGSVIQFLSEAGLINGTYLVISLRGAYLQEARLQGANLQRAHLQRAYLKGAYLIGANLQEAHLQFAHIYVADLQRADLKGAGLRGALLQYANLQGAHLKGAYLEGANLRDAKGLTQDQIEETFGDDYTILPEGINPPKSWSVSTDESAEDE